MGEIGAVMRVRRNKRRLSEDASRTQGCTACFSRGYVCNAFSPPCEQCVYSGEYCMFDAPASITPTSEFLLDHSDSPMWPTSSYSNTSEGHSSYFPPVSPALAASEDPRASLSSVGADIISHYMSQFDQYNYQLCAWTELLALPRRSAIPTILTIPARRGKKTNWATFFLPHLSLGTTEDSLSVAIAAFTALRMEHYSQASELYLRAIGLLRVILLKKNASSMDNLSYLRLWSTVLLLTEYEAQLGNQEAQYQHLAGATTLSEGAEYRFPRLVAHAQGQEDGLRFGSDHSSVSSAEHQASLGTSRSVPSGQAKGINNHAGNAASTRGTETMTRAERDLPSYLMALNRRLEHAKAIRLSRDTHWPSFYTPADRQSIGVLHDKCSELYRIVMPPVARYYEIIAVNPPDSVSAHSMLLASFTEDVRRARTAIREYSQMAQDIYGNNSRVFLSCAKPGFPFSPVIKFVDPQMAQPSSVPYAFTVFLAPFISVEEHHEAVRHMSGVFAGFQDNAGLLIDASYPDIHIAAFWRAGPERDYFQDEVTRRGGDFEILLKRIWGVIDYVQAAQGGRELSPTTILGISLREYRNAQAQVVLALLMEFILQYVAR